MGKVMSRAHGYVFTRTMQRFNIERRTDNLLAQDKPVPAPKYRADVETRQDVLKDNWEEIERAVKEKDVAHSKRLNDVYVTTKDPEGFDRDVNRKFFLNPDRPLPARVSTGLRRSVFSLEGDRSKVPAGKISLNDVQELLLEHKTDPQANNAGELAAKYNLPVAVVESLADHFQVFAYIKLDRKRKLSEKEIQDRRDPYRAQPDWVESAGELPPPTGFDPKSQPTPLEVAMRPPEKFGIAKPTVKSKLVAEDELLLRKQPQKKKLPQD